MAKAPLLFIHVRCSVSGGDIQSLAPLRDDLLAIADKYAETYGVRVKRRVITTEKAASMMIVYERRAAKTAREALPLQKPTRRGRK